MELIPAKIPRIVKRLFPNYIWRMPQEEKVIYLTFDDGPTPEVTNFVLQEFLLSTPYRLLSRIVFHIKFSMSEINLALPTM